MRTLVSAEDARTIDLEAQEHWGFNTFALVEAAGRRCAEVFAGAFPSFFRETGSRFPILDSRFPKITVLAGPGNNGADAMVMLRSWLLSGNVRPEHAAVLLSRIPLPEDKSPRAEAFRSLVKMAVKAWGWEEGPGEEVLAQADLVIDGIAGTGVKGPLSGTPAAMAGALNALTGGGKRPFVVSVDAPSGCADFWRPGMPIVRADATLAIEPEKLCLYSPPARLCAGAILPVRGVFPEALLAGFGNGAQVLDWEGAKGLIPRIPPEAYKYERGAVEIRAGSVGASGAAAIAARGAQAAGAGLVRLVADREIYPVLAAKSAGVMVFPADKAPDREPDALLAGPGWGRGPERLPALERALELERRGVPLVLDADGIALAKGRTFHGNVILTPHMGEFSALVDAPAGEIAVNAKDILLAAAAERRAVIILKTHIMLIAGPGGRLAVVDGLLPGLASGGSGDLLAGFCAALAGRAVAGRVRAAGGDLFDCAAAAAALLAETGRGLAKRFTDPMELADRAADLAGEAWLP